MLNLCDIIGIRKEVTKMKMKRYYIRHPLGEDAVMSEYEDGDFVKYAECDNLVKENEQLRGILARHIWTDAKEQSCIECGNVRRFGHEADCPIKLLGVDEQNT